MVLFCALEGVIRMPYPGSRGEVFVLPLAAQAMKRAKGRLSLVVVDEALQVCEGTKTREDWLVLFQQTQFLLGAFFKQSFVRFSDDPAMTVPAPGLLQEAIRAFPVHAGAFLGGGRAYREMAEACGLVYLDSWNQLLER